MCYKAWLRSARLPEGIFSSATFAVSALSMVRGFPFPFFFKCTGKFNKNILALYNLTFSILLETSSKLSPYFMRKRSSIKNLRTWSFWSPPGTTPCAVRLVLSPLHNCSGLTRDPAGSEPAGLHRCNSETLPTEQERLLLSFS